MNQEATGTEFDTDLAGTPTTTTTSRGRGNGRGRKVTQVTKREFIEQDDDGEEKVTPLPGMFALSDVEHDSIVRVRVFRKDPDEGMLGYIEDPNASEEEIKRKWGGSQYMIQGLDQHGKVRAARTFRIAGDPMFVSASARAQWEKSNGIVNQTSTPVPAMSPTDMLAFMREADNERRKADDDRRAREADERRQHEERMRKLELEAEDRRRKDEADREDRRRRDEAERESRRQKEIAEADQRARQHMDTMMALMRAQNEQALAVVKQTSSQPNQNVGIMEAVKMVVAIKSAFEGDGGGAAAEDTDPLNLLIKHGHEWLSGLGNAVTGAIREVKGGPPVGPAQQHPALPAAPAAPPDGSLVIPASSPLAAKLQELAGEIASRGRNPEEELAKIADNLTAVMRGQPAPHQPAAPPPAAPQPAAETRAAESSAAPPPAAGPPAPRRRPPRER